MKNNKGFTLIEMLVVVAIVGILSATVLTALGPSRNKAKDARIISALQQIRVIAETLYDGTSGKYPSNLGSNSKITNASTEITNNGGLHLTISVSSTTFAVSTQLNSGNYYCVDSVGAVGTTTANNGVCP